MTPYREGWISDGWQVLYFRPVSDDRWCKALEITVGELMPGGKPPLLKPRMELRREDAIKLWRKRSQQGWRACPPHWTPPPEVKPPARRATNTMEASANRPCF